jgi:hypothetical protein
MLELSTLPEERLIKSSIFPMITETCDPLTGKVSWLALNWVFDQLTEWDSKGPPPPHGDRSLSRRAG